MRKFYFCLFFLLILLFSCKADDYSIIYENISYQRFARDFSKYNFIFGQDGILKEVIIYKETSATSLDEELNRAPSIDKHYYINNMNDQIFINQESGELIYDLIMKDDAFQISNGNVLLESGTYTDTSIYYNSGYFIELGKDSFSLNTEKKSYDIHYNKDNLINYSINSQNEEDIVGRLILFISNNEEKKIIVKDTLSFFKGMLFIELDNLSILRINGNKKDVTLESVLINSFILNNIVGFKDSFSSAILLSNKTNIEDNYSLICGAHNVGTPFKGYSVSSVLEEGDCSYNGSNLLQYYDNAPWVEAVAGDGQGQEIKLSWDNKISGLIIGNGFFDTNRMDLFLKNNRVKTLKIESFDPPFEKIVELKDQYFPQIILFDKETTVVRLTIVDVYQGKKYNDTCINYISGLPQDVYIKIIKNFVE